jgi:hypothetical protein
MENLTHIQVFKTNIKTPEDKQRVRAVFDLHPGVDEWSVDCDDIDCVLRVVSYTLSADAIIRLINKSGFECQELE